MSPGDATSAGVKLSTRGRPRRTRYSLNRVLYAASSGATLGAAVRRRPAVAVVAGVAILVAVAVDTFVHVVARSIVLVRERLVIFVLLEERAAAFGVAGKSFYIGSSTKTRT